MKKILSIFVIAMLSMPIIGFSDDLSNMDIKTAMDSMPAEVKAKIGDFKFIFGKDSKPVLSSTAGPIRVVHRSNAVFEDEMKSCTWAFYGSLITMKEHAQELGGTSVANIQSNWKKHETSSNTTFVCANGLLMSGVAFTGTAIK